MMVPIEAPLMFSGFSDSALREFGPLFQQLGINAVQGGAASDIHSNKPAPGWEHSLNPGETVAGVLVDGDMSVTGLGTVTYNDGKRVLAFGHPFFNLGPGGHAHEQGRSADDAGLFATSRTKWPTPPRSWARCTRTATAASWACWARNPP